MGRSATAMLCYGFFAANSTRLWPSEEDEDTDTDWKDKLAALRGVKLPPVEFNDSTRDAHLAYWEVRDKTAETMACAIGSFGYLEEDRDNLLYVRESMIEVGDFGATLVNFPTINLNWIDQLKAFCELMGIEWKNPGWVLAASYG